MADFRKVVEKFNRKLQEEKISKMPEMLKDFEKQAKDNKYEFDELLSSKDADQRAFKKICDSRELNDVERRFLLKNLKDRKEKGE